MIVQNLVNAQDYSVIKNDTIEIKGKVKGGQLILFPQNPKSLNVHKLYTFRVKITSSYAISQIIITPKFSAKKTDMPDILKTYFIPDNGTIVPKINLTRVPKDSILTKTAELNDIEIMGDYTSIEVAVKMETNSSKKNSTDSTKLSKVIEFGNRNYFKWFNITTGFVGNTLANNDYNFSTDGTKIIKERSQKYDISIGAMANFNYVVCSDFKAGFGLGAALSPIDTKLRFLIGPTFTLGSKNEFAISVGIAYAKLSVLSGSISTNGVDYDIPISNTSSTTTTNIQSTSATGVVTNTQTITTTSVTNTFKSVPTYNKWEQGFFIGLTYSLIKK